MASRKESVPEPMAARKRAPARTPEARQKQLISAAVDLVERRIAAGTATSQETVHFLKLATTDSHLQQENLRLRNELLVAQAESARAEQHGAEVFEEALKAFRTYKGFGEPVE